MVGRRPDLSQQHCPGHPQAPIWSSGACGLGDHVDGGGEKRLTCGRYEWMATAGCRPGGGGGSGSGSTHGSGRGTPQGNQGRRQGREGAVNPGGQPKRARSANMIAAATANTTVVSPTFTARRRRRPVALLKVGDTTECRSPPGRLHPPATPRRGVHRPGVATSASTTAGMAAPDRHGVNAAVAREDDGGHVGRGGCRPSVPPLPPPPPPPPSPRLSPTAAAASAGHPLLRADIWARHVSLYSGTT